MKKIKLILYILSFTLIFLNNLNAENSQQIDKISKNLRCLICQGQSVYDSQSDFALSMKILIDKKINEGKTEKEIYDFLKNKYGEWIVYEPEINKKYYFTLGNSFDFIYIWRYFNCEKSIYKVV